MKKPVKRPVKCRKPKLMRNVFWEGSAVIEECTDIRFPLQINVRLAGGTASEARRLAAWLLKAADYLDYRRGKR